MAGNRQDKVRHIIEWLLFIIYIAVLSYFLFFSEYYGRNSHTDEYRYNLVLFSEIKRFLYYMKEIGYISVFINLAGNILAFVPFGFFIPLLSSKDNHFVIVMMYTLCFSLVIEVLQLLLRVGTFDVDDLLLNGLGGILGFLCYRLWHFFITGCGKKGNRGKK